MSAPLPAGSRTTAPRSGRARLAAQRHIGLSAVRGSGPRGRIQKRDLIDRPPQARPRCPFPIGRICTPSGCKRKVLRPLWRCTASRPITMRGGACWPPAGPKPASLRSICPGTDARRDRSRPISTPSARNALSACGRPLEWPALCSCGDTGGKSRRIGSVRPVAGLFDLQVRDELGVEVRFQRVRAAFRAVAGIVDAAERHLRQGQAQMID